MRAAHALVIAAALGGLGAGERAANGTARPRDAVLLPYEQAPPARRPAVEGGAARLPLQRFDDATFGARPNVVIILLDDSGFVDLGESCEAFGAGGGALAGGGKGGGTQ